MFNLEAHFGLQPRFQLHPFLAAALDPLFGPGPPFEREPTSGREPIFGVGKLLPLFCVGATARAGGKFWAGSTVWT